MKKENLNSIPLSQTSALVLVTDNNQSYQSPKAKKFLSYLDLSKGKKMYSQLKNLKPLIDEVIPNRKFFIHNYIKKTLKQNKKQVQVLVLGCGWDPILVKIYEEFPKHSFFGVEYDSVKLQKKLIKELVPEASIFYIQSNIVNVKSLIKKLCEKGWNPKEPTCLVLEGISYYINPKDFWDLLDQLKKTITGDCFVCGDFLIDYKRESSSERTKKLAYGVFEMIKKSCSQDYYPYTSSEVKKKLRQIGFRKINFFTQDAIQKKRVGFKEPWRLKEGHIKMFQAEV